MKLSPRILVPVVAAISCISALAFADGYAMIKPDSSAIHNTEVSGSTGTELTLGDNRGFIQGFEWSETSDNPCWFRMIAMFREKDSTSWVDVSKETNISCAKKQSSLKRVEFEIPGTTNSPRFVRSVQVCTSDKKDGDKNKLKGIRIRSARFDVATNKFIPEDAVESAYRTNCETWHQEVSCPDGEAATGILLMRGGQHGYAQNAYRGIALRCAAPQPQPTPPPAPVKKPGGFGFGK